MADHSRNVVEEDAADKPYHVSRTLQGIIDTGACKSQIRKPGNRGEWGTRARSNSDASLMESVIVKVV